MDETRFSNRLAAILAADAAGYSRLMAADERATVAALDAARAVFRTQIEAHHGRVVDMAGDSVLAVFDTASRGGGAALAVQAELARSAGRASPDDRRMRFRIGVHLGDVIEKADGTVYGDGVNIAARLQALAEPGGITVSDAVRGAVRGKVAARFDDQGEQTVKNIADPVRAFAVRAEGPVPATATQARPAVGQIDLSLPDKPSIAVLPFANMSGDPEQEYFTDGITEDIITELSRFHSLFVIARNSSFSYKGQSPDMRRVGKELGVRYVLEGSIRKSAQRIRVTGAVDRRADRQPPVGREVRPRAGGHLRGAGGADAQHRRGDRPANRRCRTREGSSPPTREPGCLRTRRQRAGQELGRLSQRRRRPAQRSTGRGPGRIGHRPEKQPGAAGRGLGTVVACLVRDRPGPAAAWQAGISAATRAIEIDRGDSDAYAPRRSCCALPPTSSAPPKTCPMRGVPTN